jgi:DNA topoisomerase-1
MEKYTLIITEKPDAAQRIAMALDNKGKPQKLKENGVPYFVAQKDKKLVIAPAIGHLYTIMHAKGGRKDYPIFDFEWVPKYLAEKGSKQIRTWIQTISNLAKNANKFINACDYDIEGSLIGYCILKYACGNKENTAKRMKFSTLTKDELEKAYEMPIPHLNFARIEAGKARHEIDWLYGINLSRALTSAANHHSVKYVTLSTGRVQGPTLRFLVEREKEIQCFVPTPFWNIKAKVEIDGSKYEIEYEKQRIEKKEEADTVVKDCKGKMGEIKEIETRKTQTRPPVPFDIGTLQAEAYSLFGYAPRRTMSIAERLYLQALISYPRTSSQKIPATINYKAILTGLSKVPRYKSLASELLVEEELKPQEGSKEDPAHPAIYPTGNSPETQLSAAEGKLWDLIVRRFLSVFDEPALKQSIKISIVVDGHCFHLCGRQILKEGWMKFYKPYMRTEEVLLPPLKEGGLVKLIQVAREDKFTSPPPRYNPISLLKKMEEEGIGTKATRADIIETLYNRRYIAEERINVTDLGFNITTTLVKHCPTIISVEFTRDLEEKMEKIQTQNENRENVLAKAIQTLEPVLDTLKENEQKIGTTLSDAIKKTKIQERIIGNCPNCGTGKLMILYSRKTRKRFIGCTNYFKNLCKTSFPLPQRGIVKPSGKNCRACGWPVLQARVYGKRPWTLCFNSQCPLIEERRKRHEMQYFRQGR